MGPAAASSQESRFFRIATDLKIHGVIPHESRLRAYGNLKSSFFFFFLNSTGYRDRKYVKEWENYFSHLKVS
jgi:hypothetical protein